MGADHPQKGRGQGEENEKPFSSQSTEVKLHEHHPPTHVMCEGGWGSTD